MLMVKETRLQELVLYPLVLSLLLCWLPLAYLLPLYNSSLLDLAHLPLVPPESLHWVIDRTRARFSVDTVIFGVTLYSSVRRIVLMSSCGYSYVSPLSFLFTMLALLHCLISLSPSLVMLHNPLR